MHNLFDLWMSRVGYDTFVMVVSFINSFWEPTHVTVRVFEVQNIIDGTMVQNLNTLTNALKYVVSSSPLQLSTQFVRPCNVKSSSLCH
jgi:hypothetical protein